MAEGGEETGNWWGGWIQTAKDKSVSAYEFVKQDITEFAGTMSRDVTEVAGAVKGKLNISEYTTNIHIPENLWTLTPSQQETAAAATNKVKAGLSSILGGITKALVIPPDEDDDKAVPVTVYDMAKARLAAIQLDPGTYVNEPDGPAEQYEEWLMAFVLDEKKGDISELLVSNAEVRSLYTQLVPNSVSHADFWNRYFYKVYQLEQDEARKEALKKRAEEVKNDLTWEEEEDEWGDLDAPASPPHSSAQAAAQMAAGIKAEKDAADRLEGATPDMEKTQSQAESQTIQSDSHVDENTDKLDKPEPDKTAAADSSESDKTPDAGNTQHQTAEETEDSKDSKDTCDNASPDSTTDAHDKEIAQIAEPKVKEKGDLVVVGSERTSPLSDDSSQNNGKDNGKDKESSSLDDDWEKDFDIEVTEEDLKLAQEAAKKIASGEADDEDDDWENWE